MENSSHPNKCPNCKVGDLCGMAIASAGFPNSATCNRCGFKRPFTHFVCGLCGKYDPIDKFTITNSTFLHHDRMCHLKLLNKTARKSYSVSSRERAATNYYIERSKFIKYLAGLTFEEIDTLWHREAWLDPDSIQHTSNLVEDEIRELILHSRQTKWKALNKG